MTLYEINAQLDALIDENGEITDFEALDELSIARDEKIENIGCFIKNLTAEVAALKAEKESFDERIKAKQNKIEYLKNYLGYALAGQPFETAKVKIGWRKSASTVVTDEQMFFEWADKHRDISAAFVKYPEPKPVVSKPELKKAIESGAEIPYAEIVEKNGVQIK